MTGEGAAELSIDDLVLAAGLALGELLTDTQDRPQASIARPSLRPICSSVSPASRRRSEWPTITHVARPTSIGAETLR